jgi:hypothetical protein
MFLFGDDGTLRSHLNDRVPTVKGLSPSPKWKEQQSDRAVRFSAIVSGVLKGPTIFEIPPLVNFQPAPPGQSKLKTAQSLVFRAEMFVPAVKMRDEIVASCVKADREIGRRSRVDGDRRIGLARHKARKILHDSKGLRNYAHAGFGDEILISQTVISSCK